MDMFEQGVIRPPSEAGSLLVRVTRNCPWNRCLFCPAYKGTKFSRRSLAEIKRDIDEMGKYYGDHRLEVSTAFFQDADSMILPTSDLLKILKHLKNIFPGIRGVTSYGRAKSLKKKSVSSLKALKESGLTRIHTGLESGSAQVLKLVRKGESPEDMITGGQHVMAGGISLSEYILPGVGGKELTDVHALETARVLNEIRPDFIRVRTFALPPNSPMEAMANEGRFTPLNDLEIVSEIRLLLSHLDEMPSHFRCGDFSLNLLMHVDGRLDHDKGKMLNALDEFLSLPELDQKAYVLLQRSGHFGLHPKEMLRETELLHQLHQKIKAVESEAQGGFNRYVRSMMAGQLPRPQTDSWE